MERPIYQARVEQILEHCADTRSLFLRTISERLPRYSPGMFVSVTIPLAHEVRVRPYTIATSPQDGEPFELCFNLVPDGPGAAWMFERRVGDLLDFTGPFGAFTLERPPAGEMVFIAEATAIAPIRPMLRRALAQPGVERIYLLYAARRLEHLLYRSELESMSAACPQFRFESMVIDTQPLYPRLLEEIDSRWVAADNDRTRHFYICGIGSGVLQIRDLLRQAGYERRSVRYERW
jgi:CDP-4-dehydro-6-deoxyglucose reductase, E3